MSPPHGVAESPPVAWPTSVIIVEVEDQRCGIPIEAIASLYRMVRVCPLPGAPEPIEGAIDVRGQVIGVIDLRTHLGLPHREPDPADHLVVLELPARTLALHVDRVTDFRRLDGDAVEDLADAPDSSQLLGVAKLPDGLLVVHDVEAFLAEGQAEQLDRALEQRTDPTEER